MNQDESRSSAFNVGQDVFDLYKHLYQTEFQFVHREPPPVAIFEECRSQGDMSFFEAVFGSFPAGKPLEYLKTAYLDAFNPKAYVPSAKTFNEVWGVCASPLGFGSQGLERTYAAGDDPVIFVFDPKLGTDLIDFWNLRLFARDVVPINVHWIADCEALITKTLLENHRPMRGHPQGLMHRTTIEFASSISEERARELVNDHVKNVPSSALTVKLFYSSIWDISKEDWYRRPVPVSIAATEREAELHIEPKSDYCWVECITPPFANRFGGEARWANVIRVRPPFGGGDNRAFCLPTEDDVTPSVIEHSARFSKEGVVKLASYVGERALLKFSKGDVQICSWLERKGLKAKPSDGGRLAKQVIEALGGLAGVRLIANAEILQELNRMAASRSIREDAARGVAVDETPPRTSAHSNWVRICKSRKKGTWANASIDELTAAQVMQIGLSLRCANCHAQNWYSLPELDYELKCQRCLNKFAFPQAEGSNRWFFRPLGAFAVPDYAGGGYSAALALRALSSVAAFHSSDHHFVYSTGIDLDDRRREIDFVAWRQELQTLEPNEETVVVFGEAKSFASEAIKAKDCSLLKELGTKFPGAFLIAAVMKDKLSPTECRLLRRLANWGRYPGSDGMPRAPVVILTGTELFADGDLETVWRERGGSHELALGTYVGRFNLWKLADCTQQIYLGLVPYAKWRSDRFDRRRNRVRA